MATALLDTPEPRLSQANPWPEVLYSLRVSWGEDGRPLTQAKAAARVGVCHREWQYWEGGQKIPFPTAQRLINLLIAKPELSEILHAAS